MSRPGAGPGPPVRRILGAALAVALGLWIVLAELVVPAIIADAYHGRSLDALNRILSPRAAHRPLVHFLDLWRAFARAGAMAILAHGILTIRWIGRLPGRVASVLAVGGGAFLAATLACGPRQDYAAYLEMWATVWSGGDPWWISPQTGIVLNAYGPLFNVLAWPASWSLLAPKVGFATVYLLVMGELARGSLDRQGNPTPTTSLVLLGLVNPSAWIQVAWYGHFDILVAATCLASLRFRALGRDWESGTALGVGFLLKFLPAVLVPFLVIDPRGARWRIGLGAFLTMGLGMALAWLAWGDSVARPVTFATERGSNLLSVFRFLRGTHSPLRWLVTDPNLDHVATPLLLMALLLVFLICVRLQADATLGAILSTLTTLTLYKVGFVQYQMMMYLLVPYWVVERRGRPLGRGLRLSLGVYLGWIVLFDVVDFAVGGVVGAGRPSAWLEEWVGLPTFLLASLLVGFLIREAVLSSPSRQARSDRPPPPGHR